MPRSKRDKKISLTKTDRKGLEHKQKVIEEIQECTEKYPNIYVFSVDNMRNSTLKYIRNEWKESKFFFGKIAVMKLGLKNAEVSDELIERLEGQRGLLFTTEDKETVCDWFKDYSTEEFARGGFKAAETVVLPEGPLPDFSHAIEPHLRKLGMPTSLQKGIVTLISEYTVCKKGQTLTPEQAKILKLLNRPLAKFRVNVECCYLKDSGFESIINVIDDSKKSLKKSMKAKDKVLTKKNGKTAKKTDETATMEIEEVGSDDDEEDDDESDEDMENSD
ncbi:mRNA turnover protein 4 homolog [Chironomus tepperi]|uniref:mRNA turnover protein 4 homolog n=1 Tax=Chironomus tepperi TaxID=113505 RepID=UPI00391F8C48